MRKKKIFILSAIIIFLIFLGLFFRKNSNIAPFPQSPPFDMPDFDDFEIPDRICDIKDFGAIENGEALNTAAFENAISECANNGGGHVVIPDGTWLTGAIHLRSNIDLHLEENAVILFSENPEDYLPVVFSRFEGMELMNYSPFIYANNCENISISGNGTLDGQGEIWLKWKAIQKGDAQRLYAMADQEAPIEERVFAKKGDALRPSLVEFVNCKNIRLLDFTLKNSPMWSIHPLYSENIFIRGIKINTTGHNTDGIVIDSSKYVLVDDVDLETGDDSISIKSGVDKDGWRINRPSENIVIKNSRMRKGHSGITVGSEMSGGVRNIYIQNCFFEEAGQGVRIKSMRGRGGYVENIWARNIQMDNIENAALQFDTAYDSSTNVPSSNALPEIKNININNISVTGNPPKYLVKIDGFPEQPIENIILSNIKSSSEKGIVISDAKKITLENISVSAKKKPFFQFTNVAELNIYNSVCEQSDASCVKIN
ncbi:MAG TPA: glycoside hydrolase [Candidatus Moranbacteria bacterium]|nr:glycoside hydrolase [Candidatus Moranbacteria bacterium]HAT74443.1 glycoside hydrolase [Candidatus Moranbacteria bacterium]